MQSLPQSSAVTIESLLAHADWVRALARQLVSDPASADDVEQEVWRAAIENPPRDGSNPRGWLASVARNAARTLGRANSRREAREQRNARAEALPATSELVAEAELARELAGEVLALEEPYRTVLLLRFWRSLSPDEIAIAQSLSRETVRTQLKRGLERLRDRLDRRFGDRASWLGALAPLAKETRVLLGGTASAVGGGVLALALKLGLAAGLAATAWWAWPTRVDHADDPVSIAPTSNSPVQRLETPESAQPTRQPASGAVAASGALPGRATSTEGSRVAGQVIDVEGKPLAGVEIEWHRKHEGHWEGDWLHVGNGSLQIPRETRERLRKNPVALADFLARNGNFPGFRELMLGIPIARPSCISSSDGRIEVALEGEEWEPVLTESRRTLVAEISSPGKPDWTLVVAPCTPVSGVVVDQAGVAVDDASVSFHVDLSSLASFPRATESVHEHSELAPTGADGTFRFDCVPVVQGHSLECFKPGFDAERVEVPTSGAEMVRIVLKRRREESRPELSGLVLDVDGLPARDANVQLGQDSANSDQEGHFEFKLTTSRAGTPLTATKKGFQAAVIENFGEDQSVSHSDIILRLGPAALSITGRVLLGDGRPLKKGHVQVADGTPYGSYSCYLEDITDGRSQLGVTTDAEGRFTIGGLRDRNYRLLAWADGIGQIAWSAPISAGSKDVILQGRSEEFLERLEGRVISRSGAPVERAEISLAMPTHSMVGTTSFQSFGRVRSDADGKFTLERVPRTWSFISVEGDGVKYASMPVPDEAGRPFVIAVRLEVRTTAEVADESIDRVRFLDAQGEVVSVSIHRPGMNSQREDLSRQDGTFPVFDITDDAVSAVLYQGKTEVRRVPIEIRREKLLKLRF